MAPLRVYMANISTNPLDAIDTDTDSKHSSMPSLVTRSDTDEIDMEISSDSSSEFEEGEVVEQPPIPTTNQWPPHDENNPYAPWAPPLPKPVPEIYFPTFAPSDFPYTPANQQSISQFLILYTQENVQNMGRSKLRRSQYPTTICDIRLPLPIDVPFRGATSNWEDKTQYREIMDIVKHRNIGPEFIFIMIWTTTRIVVYPILYCACHNLTPRHALYLQNICEPILTVRTFSQTCFWTWDVQHLLEAILEINTTNWVKIVKAHPECISVLEVFRICNTRTPIPVQVYNPVFWGAHIKLGTEGDWLFGTASNQDKLLKFPTVPVSPPLPPSSFGDILIRGFISHTIATAHAIAQAIMQPVSAPPIPHSPTQSFHGTSPFGNDDHAKVDPWVVAQNDLRNTTTDNEGAEPVQSPATLHHPLNPVPRTIATNTYIGNISIISHDPDADTGLCPSTMIDLQSPSPLDLT
ncbi:hypothetical protein AAF712_014961 [Marasmius tenuissimus]|uniref:Uncharacterized protein n=1 Tax=Marasmius tenuissimus TaxID=585030 RepID=A0ABR2Z9L3_9AGAR